MLNSIPIWISLIGILRDEKECIKFLFDNDILYNPQSCLYCGSSLYREKNLHRCIERQCRKSVSIFKDSFFANNNLKCSEVMMIGYLWLCGNSHSSIVKMTGHSTKTITSYLEFFRELVANTLEDDNQMIGGPGVIVEIDESKFGKNKYHRGHPVGGVWVVGGIERGIGGKCFVEVVQNRNAETLYDIISRRVLPGTIIYTDLWRGYMGINSLGMIHGTVNHSRYFVDPISGIHTNTIEGFWNGLKTQISARYRTKKITNHLLECVWRRKNKDDLWNSLLYAFRTTGYYDDDIDDDNSGNDEEEVFSTIIFR
jgi:transposase-like protein